MYSENSPCKSNWQGYWFDLNKRGGKKDTKVFILDDLQLILTE